MNKQIQNTINYKKLLIKMKINIKKKKKTLFALITPKSYRKQFLKTDTVTSI